MPILNSFAQTLPEITAWRRDLHRHPELMFDTQRTSATVAEKLRAFGCDEVVEGIGRTGVVGVIRGRQPGARAIGLRADMDALPILEASGVDHASQTPGRMHACGHDGHTAMLLGAARHLCETRNFAGTAVVIFQPAEEGGGGGREMCKDGLMARFGIDEVYGMHNWPGLAPGQFAIREGGFFASTDQFDVTVTGRGAHAAKPNDGIDPVVVAAAMVGALQTIASRSIDPVEQVVCTVTAIHSDGDAYNVIPASARIRGTVRTLSPQVRDLAESRLRAICAGVAATYGAQAAIDYARGYPVMVNHPAQTAFAAKVAASVAGSCAEAPLVMGGEDFAYMLEERPGAYILVGNGDSAQLHHPAYDFCDEAIPAGCSWWVGVVEQGMPIETAAP